MRKSPFGMLSLRKNSKNARACCPALMEGRTAGVFVFSLSPTYKSLKKLSRHIEKTRKIW